MTTLFEISWEVCNKVGGIHTVLRSKAPLMVKKYPDYFVVGPWLDGDNTEFEELEAPKNLKKILEELSIPCKYGKWLVPGEPCAILVDFSSLFEKKDSLKTGLWERYRIDSLNAGHDFDEPLCFSAAVAMLVKKFPGSVMHCHEWMTGLALLHAKDIGAKVKTVFTTHATMLGRTISGNGYPLYTMLDTLDTEEWARRLNVMEKHTTEVACANNAECFTTVSDVTANEAEKILGKYPDVITYNGFTSKKFPTFEETSLKHNQSKEILHDFLAYHFFPHYTFKLDSTIMIFTSGRYEFHNKGLDVLIDSLGELNHKLKEMGHDVTVVVFFWIIMGRRNIKLHVLENKNFYLHVKSQVEWQSKPLIKRIIHDFLTGHTPGENDEFTSSFMKELQGHVSHLHREGNPPLVTHEIDNEWQDPIVSNCMRAGLDNSESDRVKVVVYPGYLDGSDGLLNLPYYDATVGTHLGIFPSAYEPWGYTPLESIVLGVPTITTDLTGFGNYIRDAPKNSGIRIIERNDKTKEEIVEQLTQAMIEFIQLPHEQRVHRGYSAKQLAARCDWQRFIDRYFEAHERALRR